MADPPLFARLPLQLAAIFPAVPAEAWTAAIRRDLGEAADAASAGPSALAWDIGDGIRIPPYARREDLGTPPPAPLTHRRCEWRAPGSVSEPDDPRRVGRRGAGGGGGGGDRSRW